MAIARMTQSMMMERSYVSIQTVSGRLGKTQEQLTTGRLLNRPSDSPTDTTAAMRLRSSVATQTQYQRNAEDGLGWLGQIDNTLTSMLDQVRRARELGIQGVNAVMQSPASREALAAEVDQLRVSLVNAANASYLGRPVFGGITAGTAAYDAGGTFVGDAGAVVRSVAPGVKVKVNVDGPDAFGLPGATLFDDLTALSAALRAGDPTDTQTALVSLSAAQDRMTSVLADVGTRYNRLDRAVETSKDTVLDLSTALSEIEDVDIGRATIDLNMNEVAYQVALAATARLVQPSLAEFLR